MLGFRHPAQRGCSIIVLSILNKYAQNMLHMNRMPMLLNKSLNTQQGAVTWGVLNRHMSA